jgi:hypothetical protein
MTSVEDDALLEAHGPVLAAAALLAGAGWIGLAVLVITTIPTSFPLWLFFALGLTAITGTAVPFVRLLNRRFARAGSPPVPGNVILRQSVWVGVFGTTCAWLQIGRVLSLPVAFLLAVGLIAIEWFLRARDRSRRPAQPSEEST